MNQNRKRQKNANKWAKKMWYVKTKLVGERKCLWNWHAIDIIISQKSPSKYKQIHRDVYQKQNSAHKMGF